MNTPSPFLHRIKILLILVAITTPPSAGAFSPDSLFEPIFKNCSLLPEYYLRFDLSTFALHKNAFFKRQYLAEPHPDLEFIFLSYKNFISSVWSVDFLFGLGEIPGNTMFTVLNVGFGIDPKFEINLKPCLISTGFAHHCYHEIDNATFPLIHNNRFHLGASTHNRRLNNYYRDLFDDSVLTAKEKYAWSAEWGYYLKEFFGVVGPGKLNGNSPLESEIVTGARYAFAQRRSWVFTLRGDHTIGVFNEEENYSVKGGSSLYWKLALGMEAFFTRGKQGGCFYALFHLDDLPVPENAPEVTGGQWRFSKDRLLQIGIVFFN